MAKQSQGSEVSANSKSKSRKSLKGSESPPNLGLTHSIRKSQRKTNANINSQKMKCPHVLCRQSDKSPSEKFLLGQAATIPESNVMVTTTSASNRVPDHPFTLAGARPVAQTWASGNQGLNPMSEQSSSM